MSYPQIQSVSYFTGKDEAGIYDLAREVGYTVAFTQKDETALENGEKALAVVHWDGHNDNNITSCIFR